MTVLTKEDGKKVEESAGIEEEREQSTLQKEEEEILVIGVNDDKKEEAKELAMRNVKEEKLITSYEDRWYVKYNFLWRLTFEWMTPIIFKGVRRYLKMNDIPDLKKSIKVKQMNELFERRWKKLQHVKGGIFLTLYSMFYLEITLAAFCSILLNLFRLAVPLALRQVLLVIEGKVAGTYPNAERDVCLWMLALMLGLYLQTCFLAWHHGIMQGVGIKLRATLTSAIYQKSLKLSNKARGEFTQGSITNNIAVDVIKLEKLMEFVHFGWAGMITLIGCLIGIGFLLKWAVVVGVVCSVLIFPMMITVMSILAKFTKRAFVHSDKRLKYINEVLSGIKIIKYMVWEGKYLERIKKTRTRESMERIGASLARATMNTMLNFSPSLISLGTFIAFFLIYSEGGTINPFTVDIIFPSLAFFNAMRVPLTFVGVVIGFAIDVSISVNRIGKLLAAEEISDTNTIDLRQDASDDPIAISLQGDFVWDVVKAPPLKFKVDKEESQLSATELFLRSTMRTSLGFNLHLQDIDLQIPRGAYVCIVGAVGAGKSSLISAMIGEMRQEAGPRVRINGKIAYCPQQAWVMNATLLENITFGTTLDEERYNRSVNSTALIKDIQQLAGGRLIEIGEKGVNLSGGQKQRLSLARAVYRDADIIIMDDPLSAVDAHVGRHIYEKCIMDELKDKTRILVTHQLQYARDADVVIVMQDCKVLQKGTFNELLQNKNGLLSRLVSKHLSHESHENLETLEEEEEIVEALEEVVTKKEETKDEPEEDDHDEKKGELMKKEELNRGYISLKVWFHFFKAMGGIFLVIPLLILLVLAQGLIFGQDWFLSQWATGTFAGSLSPQAHLGIYAGISVAAGIFTLTREYAFYIFGTIAAYRIHNQAISKVIKAPMAWFDTTPIGRIMSRFSSDVNIMDMQLLVTLSTFFALSLQIVFTVVLICVATSGIFIIPLVPIIIIYFALQEIYRKTSREIKRLESVARSPLFAHVNETLSGIQTIRSYGVQQLFGQQNFKWIDHHNRAFYMQIYSSRWLYFRIELLGSTIVLISSIIVICISFYANSNAFFLNRGSLALAITYSLQITQFLSFAIRNVTESEINMNSVERLLHYSRNLPKEPNTYPNHTPKKALPSQWPEDGEIQFIDYKMKYRPHLPLVLNGVNMTIKSQEKIGVVGRTGAGKSTLMTAIYRLVEAFEGRIEIAGKNIADVPMDTLRRNLSIIPQEPVLFSGTVRSNLDPFDEHNDAHLWNTLGRAHLRKAIETLPSGLDSVVKENGENFSVGQRQLMCLARALLTSAKILILDEATASVDLENDALIQQTIREQFTDCTILTIAHRLNTIIDSDRVLVMAAGNIAEFDTPKALLEKGQESLFYDMICETGPANARQLITEVLGEEAASSMQFE